MELANNPGINPKRPEAYQVNGTGYEAQGFALAQTVIAGAISGARQLQQACVTAFGYSVEARTATINALNKWAKECRETIKTSGNLSTMQKASLNKIANSATVRTSEFGSIMKAMNAGMTMETIAQKHGVEDPENVSFHVLVADSRDFMKTTASDGRGRPADPFNVKLDKWLKSQAKDPANADEISTIRAALGDYLPKTDPDTSAAVAVASGKRKTDKPAVAPIAEPAEVTAQHVPAVPNRRRRSSDKPAVH